MKAFADHDDHQASDSLPEVVLSSSIFGSIVCSMNSSASSRSSPVYVLSRSESVGPFGRFFLTGFRSTATGPAGLAETSDLPPDLLLKICQMKSLYSTHPDVNWNEKVHFVGHSQTLITNYKTNVNYWIKENCFDKGWKQVFDRINLLCKWP